ncbi:uncharacterized protein LOC132294308 [Cornus florida]|uniref:uncharacterized protein LOC132294308 n=1 Tax=Cornus florida TaxID=4283 RepID=UPI0028963545|nr:uncharacterized protein LOC132294308 [Cornus florida]XP_059648098.1 uncharacterized protein LOC132294308 [Cornus florida]XP_059648099.1 uncharacterized protein LOC132294308 [Cornus florida]
MRDNEAHDDRKESTDEAASDSIPTDSPSRKRLLIDPNPNHCSTASSASVLSSDASSDRFCRKTRDLPNLSDCHSCGLRINNTDPKDKLQTLDSVWRIVLLCKKCIKRVQSAELCSYCFSETSAAEENCFRCRDCVRRVHKSCVLEYRCSAPWSYCCVESGFSVCIDCWVPQLLSNSHRVYKRKSNKKSVTKPGDSRVSVNGGGCKSLVDVANNAKCAAQKKIAAAAEAKENALRKAVMAKRAVEFANGALDLVTKKDESDEKAESLVSSCSASATTTTTVVDDAELAFQLHRAINSSPRISKNLCSINLSRLDAIKMWECNGNLSSRVLGSRGSSSSSACGKLMVNKFIENLDRSISEPSACVRASDDGSCVVLENLKSGNMVGIITSTRSEECRENSEIVWDVGLNGKCNSDDDSGVNSESESCQKHGGRCNGKPVNNLIKYSRRAVGSKAISNKTKLLYDGFNLERKAIAAKQLVHCYKRRKRLSDASAQSCAIPVQALACDRDSSQEQS